MDSERKKRVLQAVPTGIVSVVGIVLAVWCAGIIFSTRQSSPAASLVADLRAEAPFRYSLIERKPLSYIAPSAWRQKAHAVWTSVEAKRSEARSRLVQMGTNAWPEIPELVRLLGAGNLGAAYGAGVVLAETGVEEHPDWQKLCKNLRGNRTAASVFQYMAQTAPFPHYYRDSLAQRRFGIAGLGITGPAIPSVQPTLLKVMRSADEPQELRALAVRSLGEMRADAALVVLMKTTLLDQQEWPEVRGAAAVALARLSRDEGTRDVLRQALRDERALVRLGAVRGLWVLKEPGENLVPSLRLLLGHRLVSVRLETLKTIARMGPAAAALKDDVERVDVAEDGRLRAAAANALRLMARGRG